MQLNNPEQLSLYGQATLQGEGFTLSGRFRGTYAISLIYGQDARQKVLAVGTKVQLNAIAADQDLGEIELPTLGKLQVRVELSTTEVAAPKHIALSLSKGEAGSLMPQYLSVEPGEKTYDVPLGHYQVAVSSMGWKAPAEKQEIEITVDGVAHLDFKLSPNCSIMGYLQSKTHGLGNNLDQMLLRKVTLDGPNGWHREVTLEAEGRAPLKRSVTAVLGQAEPIRFDLPAKP